MLVLGKCATFLVTGAAILFLFFGCGNKEQTKLDQDASTILACLQNKVSTDFVCWKLVVII